MKIFHCSKRLPLKFNLSTIISDHHLNKHTTLEIQMFLSGKLKELIVNNSKPVYRTLTLVVFQFISYNLMFCNKGYKLKLN